MTKLEDLIKDKPERYPPVKPKPGIYGPKPELPPKPERYIPVKPKPSIFDPQPKPEKGYGNNLKCYLKKAYENAKDVVRTALGYDSENKLAYGYVTQNGVPPRVQSPYKK